MATIAKPQSYDELYPGRFLKAGLFKGKHVTLTILDVFTEGLESAEDDKKDGDSEPPSVILAFKETKMQLVIPKTNAFCLMSMFGKRLGDWVDKKVVFFPTTTKMMGKQVDCIRVWGSPHIDADLPLSIPQGLKKPLKMTMHATKTGVAAAPAPSPAASVDPAILQAWSALGWSHEAGNRDRNNYNGSDYLGHLSVLVDKSDAGVGEYA